MRSAFTLVELLSVMVIVGILALTAVPTLASLGNTQRSAAAQELIRDLTFARQYAQGTGHIVWVVFDVNAQSWKLLQEDLDNPGRANAVEMIHPGTGRPYHTQCATGVFAAAMLTSVDFDDGVEVGFDWMGRPLIGDAQLLSAAGQVVFTGGREVHVEPGTGFVQ